MPTKTFFNLPEEKRERLLAAAGAEFTRQPYGDVSINRIIRGADIPRGSFYQYFEDKLDLFRYLLRRRCERLDAVILDSLADCGGRLAGFPPALFRRLGQLVRSDGEEIRTFMAIFRQNVGMDLNQVWDFVPLVHTMIQRTDWSALDLPRQEDRAALMDLLLASSGQAIAAVLCGELTEEESRERLLRKTAIILRGLANESIT